MLKPPSGKRKHLDFERNLVRVICIANPETVRGLQWALDRQEFSDRKYQLHHLPLSQVQQFATAAPDFDICFTSIDLGQPVPLENLKKLAARPGLCAFVH